MIKLVAIDLDGTLLNNQHQVSAINKETLLKAKKQGVKIVLCTGRPLLGMRHFLEEIGLQDEGDYAITYNGGLVQKADTGEILHQITLDKSDLEEIYEVSQRIQVPMHFIDLTNIYTPQAPQDVTSIYPTITNFLPFVPKEVQDMPADIQVNKVLFSCDAHALNKRISNIPEAFKEKYTVIKSRPDLLEIMHRKVDKGTGIQALIKQLGFKQEEVMALGDEENDLAMIAYAGIGVAMGNGAQSVKEIANYITTTNEENGVSAAIEKFVLQ